MLADPASRGWATLADDVATLDNAYVYGDQLRTFIASVAAAAPPGQRIDALAAVAALPGRHGDIVLAVLADCLRRWRDWPGVAAWANDALPDLLARFLPELAWTQDTGRLLGQLRAFADDDIVRRAVLRALPEARSRLTAFGWQNIAALFGRLCGPGDAAAALLGLLDDRVRGDNAGVDMTWRRMLAGPIPMLLWSAFGHPRREVRWRAAHATRDLLAHPDPATTAPLAAALVRCLDRADPGAFRDPALYFYRLSAAAGLLVALAAVAADRPALLVPHLADLVRHATSRDLPHAQIRELARQVALAVADPADPRADALRRANQPTCCQAERKPRHAGSDRRVSEQPPLQLRPDGHDPVLVRAARPRLRHSRRHGRRIAEGWILDRWGLGEDDWWTDVRELRDQRSWRRTSHRQGSIPPEENLRLYLEYHAMMAAAGELIDAGRARPRRIVGPRLHRGRTGSQPTCPRPRGGSPTCALRSRPSPGSSVICRRSTTPGTPRPR